MKLEKRKVIKEIKKWFDRSDICTGEKGVCTIKECDLCFDCFDKLIKQIEDLK